MSNKLKGEIIVVGDLQVFDSGFQKRTFVIETEGEYKEQVQFEVYKDRAVGFSYKKGQHVEVEFNVKGNEYQGKYYVNLNAWKIEKINTPVTVVAPDPSVAADDLPF